MGKHINRKKLFWCALTGGILVLLLLLLHRCCPGESAVLLPESDADSVMVVTPVPPAPASEAEDERTPVAVEPAVAEPRNPEPATIVPASAVVPDDTAESADPAESAYSAESAEDSLSVPEDSRPIFSTRAHAADTLHTLTDTIDAPADTLTAVADTIDAPADTLTAVADTLDAPVDSMPALMDSTLAPVKVPVVALRTNLLYDAVLVPNIGIEVWLPMNFTIGADWFATWLSSDARHWYWQGYGGYLTLRYYFGKKAQEKRFSGHHVGIYGSALTYDVEFGGKGYQAAKFGFGGGVEYGYSLQVHRCLTIDFNIGVGYQGGEYKVYRPTEDGTGHYEWLATYRRRWFGPTKAEISLKWLISAPVKQKKKGGEL